MLAKAKSYIMHTSLTQSTNLPVFKSRIMVNPCHHMGYSLLYVIVLLTKNRNVYNLYPLPTLIDYILNND